VYYPAHVAARPLSSSVRAHMLKVLTWCLFSLCALLALYMAYLPLAYLLSPNDPFRGETLEVWFWVSLFASIPVLLFAISLWLQRQRSSPRILALWVAPLVVILASVAVESVWP
jgi:hypothetical protein